jgi:S-DNA-T family DNA segregation ATPase FtsK/SpoIIIE
VDVLTGVIKANFTHRVAFQVSSKVDSRTILDMIGAERLVGAGDMLYLGAGASKPLRTQGVFVSDKEMSTLIEYLRTQGEPRYREEVVKWQDNYADTRDLIGEKDELYDAAVRVVLETGQASISMIQRRLRVGYNRAARLIDAMEQNGIVGPAQGSQPREILRPMEPF